MAKISFKKSSTVTAAPPQPPPPPIPKKIEKTTKVIEPKPVPKKTEEKPKAVQREVKSEKIKIKFSKPTDTVAITTQPETQVKKRGRPSKQEVEKREKEKLAKENELKDKLLSVAAETTEEEKNEIRARLFTSIPENITLGSYNIYKVNERVKDITGIGKIVHKGTVVRQDINSRCVLVLWKDASKQWHDANSIMRITEKEFRKKEFNEPLVVESTE